MGLGICFTAYQKCLDSCRIPVRKVFGHRIGNSLLKSECPAHGRDILVILKF